MKHLKCGLLALTAVLALTFGNGAVRAADEATTPKARKGARGKVSKLDTTAKTFVVTNKKAGEFKVTYTDKTKFKKAAAEVGGTPTDAAVTDLKEGMNVQVRGALEGTNVTARQVVIGARRKKKAAQ